MALSDKDGGKFAMQLMADAYKAKGDTVAWIKSLEEGILKFPGNDYFFANLVDYYNSSNQPQKLWSLLIECYLMIRIISCICM